MKKTFYRMESATIIRNSNSIVKIAIQNICMLKNDIIIIYTVTYDFTNEPKVFSIE